MARTRIATPMSDEAFEQLALDDPEGHWEMYCGVPRRKPAMTFEPVLRPSVELCRQNESRHTSYVGALAESGSDRRKPSRIDNDVIVGEGDDRRGQCRDTAVMCISEARPVFAQIVNPPRRDISGAHQIGGFGRSRRIIHDDDLETLVRIYRRAVQDALRAGQ